MLPQKSFKIWIPEMAFAALGHSRKHPYHPNGGNWKLPPPPLSLLDVLIHLLLSETILSPLPLRTAEISSVGGSGSFLEQPILRAHFVRHFRFAFCCKSYEH